VALRVQQHVLGLEVPVHNVDGVQVAQRGHQLRREKAHHGLGEGAEALQVEKQLPARAKVGHHVQLVRRLEGEAQRHHKGVLDAAHDAPLRARVLHLPPPHHLGLF
jgi:hypothetical protein